MRKFIQDTCLTTKGGLNNRICIDSWWSNRGLENEKQQILTLTNFLPENAEFSRRVWHVYNSIYNIPECVVCKNACSFNSFKEGYYKVCGFKCSTQEPERRRKISIADRSSMVESSKKSNLKKYGVEFYFQTKEFQLAAKQTKKEKYGSETYNGIEKLQETNLKKYGNKSWFASVQGQEILRKKREKNGGYLGLSPEINAKINDIEFLRKENETKGLTQIARECGVTYRTIALKLGEEFNFFYTNKNYTQDQLLTECKTLFPDLEIRSNDRLPIYPKELDVFFPERNFAIEFNGLYWHSFDGTKPEYSKRHLDKHNLCLNQNIDLIQITDKEFNEKREIVLDIIKKKLGRSSRSIRASKCEIVNLSVDEEREFLDLNHIQGYSPSAVKLGLKYCNELVFLMTFSKPRFSKKYQFELLRLCSKLNTKIHGGASKLFKHFINQFHPDSIISYCDISKFSGNVYEKLGFKLLHQSDPNYFYFRKNKFVSRYQAQKSKLSKLLGDDYDQNKSEVQNMFDAGFRRYWDCGNKVYLYESSQSSLIDHFSFPCTAKEILSPGKSSCE